MRISMIKKHVVLFFAGGAVLLSNPIYAQEEPQVPF